MVSTITLIARPWINQHGSLTHDCYAATTLTAIYCFIADKVEVKNQNVQTKSLEMKPPNTQTKIVQIKDQQVQAESTEQLQGIMTATVAVFVVHDTFSNMHEYMTFSLKNR